MSSDSIVTVLTSTSPSASSLPVDSYITTKTTVDPSQCPGYYHHYFTYNCGPNINNTPTYVEPIFVSNYEFAYTFHDYQQWLANNVKVPIIAVIIYLAFIWLGTKFMENRKPFNLKWSLFVWNAGLAIFSIMGSIRAAHDVLYLTSNFGFNESVCQCFPHNVRGFWMFYFALSKVVELGDTVFLVLRKRPVIFLHWYHHVSVLLFTWFACAQAASFGRYFIGMNLVVHSFMYTYFAAQTLGIRPPKFVSMFITTLQILQMIGGMYVVNHAHREISAGNRCEVPQATMTNALLMYASYFILFVNFFLDAYVFKRKPTSFKVVTMDKNSTKRISGINGNVNNYSLNNNNNNIGKGVSNESLSLKNTSSTTLVHRNGHVIDSDRNNNIGKESVCTKDVCGMQ